KIQISDDNESSQSDVLGLGEKNKIINVQLKKILNHYLFGKLEDGGGIKDKVFLNNAINYFSDSTQYSAFLNYNNMNYSLPYSNTPFFGSLNTLISANNQISSNFGGAGGIGSIVSNNDAGFITMMNGPVLGTNDRFSTGLRGTMPFPNSRARLYLSVVYVHNSGTLLDSASGYEIFSSDKYRTLGNDLLNRSSDLARVFLNWTCQLNSHSTLKIAPAFTFYKSVDSSYSRSTISQYDTSLNTYTTASDPRTSSSTQGLDFSYLNDFSSRFRVVLSGNSQLVNTSPQKSVNSYLIVKNEEGGNISTLNAQGLQWTLNPKLFLSYAISRKISTQASYAVYYDNSKSNIEILSSDYANSINQKQEVNFVDRSLAQDGQANARWRNKVWEIDLGGGYYKVDFIRSGNDSFSFKNEEAYFYPTFAIKYSRSKLDQFSVEVNSRFHIPTVTQLLPILDSTDRVHLTVGNPLLKPEFLPQLNASYSRIDVVGGNILLIRYSLVEAVNKIIYRYYKLGDGRTLSMPVNSNSGTNNRLYYDFSKTFYNGKLEIAAGGAMSIAHYVAYDSATNYYNIQRFQQNISLNFISTHLESRTSFNIAPSYNQFSSQSFSATDFSVDQIVSLFFLPFKFEVTADYLHPSGYFLVTERNIFNLGCSAEYPIYKRLVLHLQARDLLNMTRFNYARNLTGNILDDKTYNTVGRFVMASLIFKFNTFTSK
ncbi:MAG TPA: outer membrane beta-barrel protein, partial [Puia sp.]|nr:outer membrane beta-barrel protein [Puia sp.]